MACLLFFCWVVNVKALSLMMDGCMSGSVSMNTMGLDPFFGPRYKLFFLSSRDLWRVAYRLDFAYC